MAYPLIHSDTHGIQIDTYKHGCLVTDRYLSDGFRPAVTRREDTKPIGPIGMTHWHTTTSAVVVLGGLCGIQESLSRRKWIRWVLWNKAGVYEGA